MQAEAKNIFEDVQKAGSVSYITYHTKNQDMNALRQLADQWRQKESSDVFVTAADVDGKVSLLVAVADEKVKAGLKAGDIIKAIAGHIGGGGGGRPNLAQAGGKKPEGIPAALSEVGKWLEENS